MSVLVDLLSWLCLLAGGAFCVIGATGMIRMPDFYTRVHAASVIETLGAGLILLGLLLQAGINPRVPLAMVTISLATLILLPAVIALMRPGFIFR